MTNSSRFRRSPPCRRWAGPTAWTLLLVVVAGCEPAPRSRGAGESCWKSIDCTEGFQCVHFNDEGSGHSGEGPYSFWDRCYSVCPDAGGCQGWSGCHPCDLHCKDDSGGTVSYCPAQP